MIDSAESSSCKQEPRSRQLSVSDVFDCACANIRNGALALHADVLSQLGEFLVRHTVHVQPLVVFVCGVAHAGERQHAPPRR